MSLLKRGNTQVGVDETEGIGISGLTPSQPGLNLATVQGLGSLVLLPIDIIHEDHVALRIRGLVPWPTCPMFHETSSRGMADQTGETGNQPWSYSMT